MNSSWWTNVACLFDCPVFPTLLSHMRTWLLMFLFFSFFFVVLFWGVSFLSLDLKNALNLNHPTGLLLDSIPKDQEKVVSLSLTHSLTHMDTDTVWFIHLQWDKVKVLWLQSHLWDVEMCLRLFGCTIDVWKLQQKKNKIKKELSGDELPQTRPLNLLLAQITATLCHV